MSRARRALVAAAVVSLAAAAVAGCAPAEQEAAEAAGSAGGYPLTLTSPFGETVLEEQPERVAVVSSVDLDIALALGVVPVIGPRYGHAELEPWAADALDSLGGAELATYDSTDGVDYEAIAAAEPDVILATSGWTLDEDYAHLSKIAPVVSYQGEDGLGSMTWADRTEEAGTALGVPEEAQSVIDGVAQQFDAAAAEHPEFAGTSFTYAVIHPEQVTYISYEGSDVTFFTRLGLTLPETASQFSASSAAVSRENLDLLDADVLLVGYPFGDEGLLSQSALEGDVLFQQVPAVAGGHYAVIDDLVASPLAYPTPLSEGWVLERLVPVLADAVAGG
ncbi:ABC transporter substrate-binding protein [Cellulomonas timonensis]|uniref:ABC transporter substrate-binding protein n=1 Tax=Cellulomonas timonensis TaxID=1689271 RepID=UPI000832913B|nr:ABC transporter substrate-binding protein [Cellulomonas timonensis]